MIDVMEFVLTEDGSCTLLDPATGELYHNRAGAYTEALENYFLPSSATQRLRANGKLKLLDVCFGLGYNSFVLLERLLQENGLSGEIEIDAVEIDRDLLDILPRVLEDSRFSRLRSFLLSAGEGKAGCWCGVAGELKIRLEIHVACLRQTIPLFDRDYDLVFHDPFSPKRLPEFWTIDLFREYYRLLAVRGGALLTYSSAVAVRAALNELGFFLKRTAAVGAKTGGTLAALSDLFMDKEYVFDLSPEEQGRLFSRTAVPYRDPGLKCDGADIVRRRQKELE